jgi:hypothetical protein
MYPNELVRRLYLKMTLLARSVLLSGLTPQKLSLTICLGVATGVMPLVWGTTLLCAGLATWLKLNQAAIQAVNYCCYPLQIALFLPFCALGEVFFPWGPPVTGEALTTALHGDIWASASLVALASARGIGAWLVTVAPLALVAYPVLKRYFLSRKAQPSPPAIVDPPKERT